MSQYLAWNAPNNIDYATQAVIVESPISQAWDQEFGPMEPF